MSLVRLRFANVLPRLWVCSSLLVTLASTEGRGLSASSLPVFVLCCLCFLKKWNLIFFLNFPYPHIFFFFFSLNLTCVMTCLLFLPVLIMVSLELQIQTINFIFSENKPLELFPSLTRLKVPKPWIARVPAAWKLQL